MSARGNTRRDRLTDRSTERLRGFPRAAGRRRCACIGAAAYFDRLKLDRNTRVSGLRRGDEGHRGCWRPSARGRFELPCYGSRGETQQRTLNVGDSPLAPPQQMAR